MASSTTTVCTSLPSDLPVLLTLKQAASIFGCSEHHLFNLVKRGEIEGVRLGRAWRIPRDKFLTACGLV